MRIGIIEDDRLLNQALGIALREAGYDTVSIHSKKEALTHGSRPSGSVAHRYRTSGRGWSPAVSGTAKGMETEAEEDSSCCFSDGKG